MQIIFFLGRWGGELGRFSEQKVPLREIENLQYALRHGNVQGFDGKDTV